MVTFSLMRCQRTLKFQNLDMIAVSTTQRGQGKDNRFHDFATSTRGLHVTCSLVVVF